MKSWNVIGGVLVLAVVVAWLFRQPDGNRSPIRQVVASQPRETSVIQTIRLGEHETLRVLSVPDATLNDSMFDTRCLLYVNENIPTAINTCLNRLSLADR